MLRIRIKVTADAPMQSGNVEPIEAIAACTSWEEAESELTRLRRFIERETSRLRAILREDEEEPMTEREYVEQERNSHMH